MLVHTRTVTPCFRLARIEPVSVELHVSAALTTNRNTCVLGHMPPPPHTCLHPSPLQVYTLWIGGKIRVASSLDGPWEEPTGATYPGGNPAPFWHAQHKAFYMVNQGTTDVWTTPRIGEPWTKYASINHSVITGVGEQYHVEDPFMWLDQRDNWHIINHACVLVGLLTPLVPFWHAIVPCSVHSLTHSLTRAVVDRTPLSHCGCSNSIITLS